MTVYGLPSPLVVVLQLKRGTWGINPRPANLSNFKNPMESLLSTLKQKNFIPSLSYGYTAGAHYRLKQALGSLTLGGYDSSRFVPSNLSFALAPEASRDLIVGIQSITAESAFGPTDSTSLLPNPISSFIDSTVPQIWLPLDACEAFEKAFGLRWDSNTELYLVNETLHNTLLAHNASITFQIRTVRVDSTSDQTVNITLPYASFDLEVNYPTVKGSSSYFPIRRAANQSQYTLGRTFLQEAYLIVDYERSNFSVNPCTFVENDQQSIFPIMSVNASNETITYAGNGTGSLTHNVFLGRSLSGSAVAGITVATILSLLIFLTFFAVLIVTWRRRRQVRSRYPPPGNAPNKLWKLDGLPILENPRCEWHPRDRQGRLLSCSTCPVEELDITPDALERAPREIGPCCCPPYDLEKPTLEALDYDSCARDDSCAPGLRQNADQDPEKPTRCEEASVEDTTSPSHLASERVMETAEDSDHVDASKSDHVDASKSDHVDTSKSDYFDTSKPNPAKPIESETHKKTSFQVLDAGHWTLEIWPSVAEHIRTRYRDIMGIGNPGSINLLSCSDPGSIGNSQDSRAHTSPAVCVSCRYPDRVNHSVLKEILGPLKDLAIIVRAGSVRRSVYGENCSCTQEETCLPCQSMRLTSAFECGPAVYGRYMQRPDCGASIGVDYDGLERERVTLGGYIYLRIGDQWILNAVTCHHLIEESDVETPGIQNRSYGASDAGIPGVKYAIQSSAKIDHDGEVKRLRQRVENTDQSRRYEVANIEDAYDSLVKADLRFGEARYSSGISIDEVENLQVDWMLIDAIERTRVGKNFVGDTASFMEGARMRLGGSQQVPTEYLSKEVFDDFMRYRKVVPDGQMGSLSRIHGRGCQSGLSDGHLNRAAGIFCIGEMEPTIEWSFKPRETLGTRGDSGAWIFTESGKLLGQIFAQDDYTRLTYYTPAWALFNHIKRVTGATDIRLPRNRDSWDSGYGSSVYSVGREFSSDESETCTIQSFV
ncbi:hypothetical protein MMC07_003234 [Pseudocyphellaria aurata]|nr:hypothetical protein [Pseudocyphellaria aurata]